MTEKSDPVEVMARAIFAEQHSSLDFDLCREATQSNYRSMARSALAAAEAAGMVMVPKVATEAMKRAFYDGKDERKQGVNCQIGNSGGLHSRSAELAWRFMIEAASLAQQEKP